jgi:hypothetical protein
VGYCIISNRRRIFTENAISGPVIECNIHKYKRRERSTELGIWQAKV